MLDTEMSVLKAIRDDLDRIVSQGDTDSNDIETLNSCRKGLNLIIRGEHKKWTLTIGVKKWLKKQYQP